MLFPYKDANPVSRFPIITILLISANIVIFFGSFFTDWGYLQATRELAMIPAELLEGNLPDSRVIHPWISPLTSLFAHGGLSHLLFNMLFLWIFGNNVEDSMSRSGYLVFYLLTGIAAALAFAIMNNGSALSLIGASGAISGVLGAYLFLFPFARVHALLFIFPVRLPAFIYIALWFITQISGLMGGGGNIAWISHITGFAAGIILHRFFIRR